MQTKEIKRFNRLKKKIKSLINTYKKRCIFLTLSFNNKTLSNTNEQTRERYIKQYLNKNFAIYICNRDYGTKTEREHYHALIITTTLKAEEIPQELKKCCYKVNLKSFKNYGNIYAVGINRKWYHKDDTNNEKTAEDLAKHFIKESTKKSRVIQSRKVPSKDIQIKMLKSQLKITDLEEIKETIKLYNK